MNVKTLLILTALFVVIACRYSSIAELITYQKCARLYDDNLYEETISCCEEKLKNDKGSNRDILMRFIYAVSLHKLQRFEEAKEQYEILIANCKDEQLLENSKYNLKLINDYFVFEEKQKRKLEQYKRQDVGHYYTDLEKTAIWEKPKEIKVYINESDPRADVLKQAFEKWDFALYSMVNFQYVKSASEADITAQTRPTAEVRRICEIPSAIGCAESQVFSYNNRPSKLFFKRVNIYIAPDDGTKENTDSEYLSITLHEIGHALGILSHSPAPGDAMYEDSSNIKHGTGEVSNRDVNTVRRLYGFII